MAQYKLLVCGGTFDLLHKGHKDFIKQILEISDKVILGLTSDLYTKSFKNGSEIERYEVRKKNLVQFLDSINAKTRVNIVPIDDIYGPLLTGSVNPQVIAVTPETQSSAEEINLKRKGQSLKELKIIVFPLVLAQDGKAISASRIRNGEIDREGRLYISQEQRDRGLILPQNMRSFFQEPIGEVLNVMPADINPGKTITIGDVTTRKFNLNSSNQFLSIIDFLVQRKRAFNALSDLGFTGNENVIQVKNLPGSISRELLGAVQDVLKKQEGQRNVILVDGEEDLAVSAVILIVPLGYVIFYGQPNLGLVKVNVTEEIKERIHTLVQGLTLG